MNAHSRQSALAPHVERLRATGAYATTAPGRAVWPTLQLQARLFRIYLEGARIARRGGYDDAAYAWCSLACLRAIESVGGRVTVEGLDHLAEAMRRGPVVGVGNHMSNLDPLLLPGLFLAHGRVAFVIKKALLDVPVFGTIMRAVPNIAVGRDDPRGDLKTVLTDGEAWLRRGVAVMVFPQATRSAALDLARFNSLGVKLAARVGATVVPVAIRTDLLANGRWFKDVGRVDPARPVHVAFGAPLAVEGNGAHAQAAIVAFLEERLRAWGVPVVRKEPTP